MSDVERFLEKVDRSGGEDSCWLWTAAIHADGYGGFNMQVNGRWQMVPAHRASLLVHGITPIRPGLDACHKVGCPRNCVNPRHLRFDTHAANMSERNAGGESMKNRLSDADKDDVCRRYVAGETVVSIAKLYKCTRQNIHYLVKKRGLVTHTVREAANDNDGVQTVGNVEESVRDVG